jgi:pyridoxine 4-dehydrogenase
MAAGGPAEVGMNFIVTADVCSPGHNEQLIRKALHSYPADLVVDTKAGLVRGAF